MGGDDLRLGQRSLGAFPVLLLLLFAAWAGTWQGAVTWGGALAGHAALLTAALFAGATPDPWRLGRKGRLVLPGLLAAVVASAWMSPVPRAARVGLLLLPAYLLLPVAVERCWSLPAARRWGLRSLGAAVVGVSVWSLGAWVAGASERASLPLGHHGPQALWTVVLLPLAVLSWREGGAWRWMGASAGVSGALAVAASGSLGGGLALGVSVASLVFARWRRRRGWHGAVLLLAVGLVLALGALWALSAPGAGGWFRLQEMIEGRDSSLNARRVYWQAGFRGVAARPWLGWGPGSVPWTLSEHLVPRPGVSPPGEVVGQLHSLPLEWAYELGLVGLGLALLAVGAFAAQRLREVAGASDPALLGAALAGLAGGAAGLMGQAPLTQFPALGVALGLVAGAALAAGKGAGGVASEPLSRWRRAGGAVYVLAATLALLPIDGAHRAFEEGRVARAVALDPSFPLYRAWIAWREPGPFPGAAPREASGRLLRQRARAEAARRAARDAWGVGPLWLSAGALGAQLEEPWAGEALAGACRLDPLGALAPFHLMLREADEARAVSLGARALLAEPRLAAATAWDDHPDRLEATVQTIQALAGVEAGWREALADAVGRLPAPAGPRASLGWWMDETYAESLSAHLFHRHPRALSLAPVEVWRNRVDALALPPATGLPGTSPALFSRGGCGLGTAAGSPATRAPAKAGEDDG